MSQDTMPESPQPVAEAESLVGVASHDLFSDSSCGQCGSRNLTWQCQAQNRGGVVDGRICMREVGVIFFLGCDECSETVRVIDGDVVAVVLTAIHSENNELSDR